LPQQFSRGPADDQLGIFFVLHFCFIAAKPGYHGNVIKLASVERGCGKIVKFKLPATHPGYNLPELITERQTRRSSLAR
jgi:hypothetical protein